MTVRARIVAGLVLALVALGVGPRPSHASDCAVRLFDFEIQDQFEREHTQDELLGQVAVIVWSDRKAFDWSDGWDAMLREALQGQIEGGMVEVRRWAHTKGAPFFVKGRIRRSFPEERSRWALLDWDGELRKRFDPPEDHVTVYVFDREGCLVAQETGEEVDAEAVARLARAAQQVLVDEAGGVVPGEIQPRR